MTPAVRLHQF